MYRMSPPLPNECQSGAPGIPVFYHQTATDPSRVPPVGPRGSASLCPSLVSPAARIPYPPLSSGYRATATFWAMNWRTRQPNLQLHSPRKAVAFLSACAAIREATRDPPPSYPCTREVYAHYSRDGEACVFSRADQSLLAKLRSGYLLYGAEGLPR